MPRPRRARAATVVALGVTMLLMAAACGSSADSKPAATVAATPISIATVNADLAAEASVPAKYKTYAKGSPLLDPDAKKKGTYTAAAKAEALGNRILYTLYSQRIAALHLTVTAADRKSVHSAMCADATTGKVPAGTSCPPLARYPLAYRNYLLDTQARVVALGNVIYGQVFDSMKASHSAALEQTCFSEVQVATANVANTIREAISAGAKIGPAAAASIKAGTAAGPSSSCRFGPTLPDQLVAAKVGSALTFQSGNNLFVVQVDSRHPGTRAEFQSDPPTDDATVNAAVSDRIHHLVAGTHVSVDPTYGRWNLSSLSVIPPGGKVPTTTTATTAPATTAPAGSTTTTTAP